MGGSVPACLSSRVLPHSVWSLAAEFIDGLWGQPIVDMKAMAPLVYSSHPHLEALTSLRGRLQQAIVRACVCVRAGSTRCCLARHVHLFACINPSSLWHTGIAYMFTLSYVRELPLYLVCPLLTESAVHSLHGDPNNNNTLLPRDPPPLPSPHQIL